MKYQRWYDEIIDRARHRKTSAYKERHHIIPRAFGGSDDPSNLVDLTYREHFLVHWLLTKTLIGRERVLMLFALHCMTLPLAGGRIVAGWRFEVAKRLLKREAIRRLQLRRASQKAERKHLLEAIETGAAASVDAVYGLNPAKKADRNRLLQMTNMWIAADPKRVNRLQHRRYSRPR